MKTLSFVFTFFFIFVSSAYAYLGIGPLIPIVASSVLWLFGIIVSIIAIFFTFFKGIFFKKKNKLTNPANKKINQ